MRGIHHSDGITRMGHHAQIVRDEDQGHVQTLDHAADELQNRCLDGDVEGRGGLIGDQKGGVAAQGHGQHDALPHAAAKFMHVIVRRFPEKILLG
jgi:hypothetical protein